MEEWYPKLVDKSAKSRVSAKALAQASTSPFAGPFLFRRLKSDPGQMALSGAFKSGANHAFRIVRSVADAQGERQETEFFTARVIGLSTLKETGELVADLAVTSNIVVE